MSEKANSIKKYWSKQIVLPLAAVAAVFTLIVAALSMWNVRAVEDRSLTTIVKTLAIVVAEPILLGDHLEVQKRISTVGLKNGMSIIVQGEKGETIAMYPAGTNLISQNGVGIWQTVVANDGRVLGRVYGRGDHESLFADRNVFVSIAMFLAFVLTIGWVMRRTRPIFNDLSQLTELDQQVEMPEASFKFVETRATFNKIREQSEKIIEAERERMVIQIARQVAHDIRSPLSALDTVTRSLGNLPEDKRLIIRSATSRIRDIANALLEKSRGPVTAEKLVTQELNIHLLSAIVDSIVSEKRIQYRSRIDIEIIPDLGPDAYGVFARIQPAGLQRVLSNLIDNSVEAMQDGGRITVALENGNAGAMISVVDTGAGIRADVLPKLMNMGVSVGKPNGSGLGLYHARSTIESWGGKVSIESVLGHGAIVSIHLPRSPTPAWFLPELKLNANSSVVIIDDDDSIHRVWRERFESNEKLAGKLKLVHISCPADFRKWFSTARPSQNDRDVTYLVDFEFLDSEETGISLIESLKIEKQSVLVTSRYEEPKVAESCLRLGLHVIPKPIAGFVPLRLSTS